MLKTPFMWAAGLGLAVVLSSCGQAGPTTPGGGAGANQNQDTQAGTSKPKRLGGALALFADLDLTEAQRAQLLAIAEKYRAQWPPAPMDRIRALLTAETVDTAALRAALTAPPAADPRVPLLSAMLVEARAVLTDAQRATLVQQLQAVTLPAPTAKPAPTDTERSAWLALAAQRLSLTEEQKAAFSTYLEQQRATGADQPAPVDHSARRDAMVRFFQTGEATALNALEPSPAPPVAVEALINLATKLNQAQRQALFGERQHRPRH
ncbi:LTXXQ motif protein [compost metagenome]